ncbi:MAG: sulfur carrier protein ThiS [Planctomycetota bacterium]|jgi:thiamine biosynthesis protein ThiS
MQIIVNGEPMEIEEATSISALLVGLKLDPKVVVAELNGRIVPREVFPESLLSRDDRLELVRMVGGG